MAGQRLTFHFPPEGEPGKLLPLLEAMYFEDLQFPTVKALLGYAQERGLGQRTEMQILAMACGVLVKTDRGISLSMTARTILQTKPEVYADLIHYLLYTGWQQKMPSVNTFLWSYRQVTDTLWERSQANLVSIAKVIALQVDNYTQQVFGNLPGYAGSSFSTKSIRGIRKWLEALRPPVIDANHEFQRRYFCPPELAVLAVGWGARTTGGETGIDVLLTPERREIISKLCVLEPSALDKVIDWMLPLYDDIVRPGTNAGAYGRFLHFLKWPEITDLVS